MGIFFYFDILNTSYHANLKVAFLFFLFGGIAFYWLPYQTTILQVFAQTVYSINFYGGAFTAAADDFSSIDAIGVMLDLLTFILAPSFLYFFVRSMRTFFKSKSHQVKEEQKAVAINQGKTIISRLQKSKPIIFEVLFAAFATTAPLIFAFCISFAADNQAFREGYVSKFWDDISTIISWVVIISLFLFGFWDLIRKVFAEKFSSSTKNQPIHPVVLIIFIVAILSLFPALKVQASKYKLNQMLQHEELYQTALEASQQATSVPGEDILLFESAAKVGNPFAMYETAKRYFSPDSFVRVNQENIKKNIEYLYLATLLGNKKAQNLLFSYAETKDDNISFAFNINMMNQFLLALREISGDPLITYTKHYARCYLGFFYAFDNKDRPDFHTAGKAYLENEMSNNLSSTPLIFLAHIKLTSPDNKEIEEGLKMLEEASKTDVEALFFLGKHYLDKACLNEDGKRDEYFHKAMKYLLKGKQSNHADSSVLWAMTILDNDYDTAKKQDAAYLLARFEAEFHLGARLQVALRYLYNDPFIPLSRSIENAKRLKNNQEIIETSPLENKREGIARLQALALLDGENKDLIFDTNVDIYLPNVFGREIVLSRYQLAYQHVQNEMYFKACQILERPTQFKHTDSMNLQQDILTITGKLCSEHLVHSTI